MAEVRINMHWEFRSDGAPLMMDEDLSCMMLYAVRYALSNNGDITSKHVIGFITPYLPYLHKSILYVMEHDIHYMWDQNENIGQRMRYAEDWKGFIQAIHKERERRAGGIVVG